MLRFLAVLTPLLGFLLALTPTHLKPGALTNKLGEINLVEEILVVRYPYTTLLNTTNTVKIVSEIKKRFLTHFIISKLPK